MKFCTKCGAQLKDEAQFCNKCGTPCLEQNDKATAPEKIEEAAPAALEESKKEEKKENVEVAKKEEKPSPKRHRYGALLLQSLPSF